LSAASAAVFAASASSTRWATAGRSASLRCWSDALASKLREEEAQLGKLKAERTAMAKRAGPGVVPQPKAIAGYVKNLLALLETDSTRGREILARFVAPIVMTPKAEGPDRGYRATGAFNMSFFLSVGTVVPDRSGKSSCAGRI